MVTLENAVYMNMKNDVAFLVNFQLNLYEHQSTWNPNMPLRNLFYAAKEYQALTRDQSLYAPQLVKIPTPNFVVFYNGDKEIGDSCVLKISDSFEQSHRGPRAGAKGKGFKNRTREEQGASGHLPDLKRVHALCGACEASCEDHGGPGGGAPGCHRMHPGGDPFGFPLQEPSGGDRSEYI